MPASIEVACAEVIAVEHGAVGHIDLGAPIGVGFDTDNVIGINDCNAKVNKSAHHVTLPMNKDRGRCEQRPPISPSLFGGGKAHESRHAFRGHELKRIIRQKDEGFELATIQQQDKGAGSDLRRSIIVQIDGTDAGTRENRADGIVLVHLIVEIELAVEALAIFSDDNTSAVIRRDSLVEGGLHDGH